MVVPMTDAAPGYSVGEQRVSQSRTITDADIRTWAGLVFDFTRLHVDAELMRDSRFGRPIAHGYIAMNLSIGLFFPEHSGWYAPDERTRTTAWEQVRFVAPVFAQDTLHCRRTIVEADAAEPQAWVKHLVEVINQEGTVVMTGYETLSLSR
jgi:acyl dehydratase